MQNLYNQCFEKDGTVKLCGRDNCKQLIEVCEQLKPGCDFGNSKTGMMNIKNIQALAKEMAITHN